MNNKVVTTAAKALFNLGIPVCRFNFRGVGLSSGAFDQGEGETGDFLELCEAWRLMFPKAKFLFLGFSFGSYIAYRAAQSQDVLGLLLIAPPVFRFNFKFDIGLRAPELILMGDCDEVVAPEDVSKFAQAFSPSLPILWFEQTGHFFHGRLVELRSAVTDWAKQCLNLN